MLTPCTIPAVTLAWLVFGACASRTPDTNAEVVGDPLGAWHLDDAYARNLWDLQAFDGRLFIGYGDAVRNSGPTDVITYEGTHFTREHQLGEEAIHIYRVIGDRLFVPGVDAHRSPDGFLYIRANGTWTKRTLPGVVHVTDVAQHRDRLCVSMQSSNEGGVMCSRDDGVTWTHVPTFGWRAVSLFVLGEALYVASHGSGVRRVDPDTTTTVAFGLALEADATVMKPQPCGDGVAFIVKRVVYEGRSAHVNVIGAFQATRALAVTPIETAGIPSDVFVDGEGCSVLANRALDDGRFEATITTLDGKPRAKLTLDAMARSAERFGEHYYVGTGCEFGACTSTAGRLVRVLARSSP
jgi:hypothetical protein